MKLCGTPWPQSNLEIAPTPPAYRARRFLFWCDETRTMSKSNQPPAEAAFLLGKGSIMSVSDGIKLLRLKEVIAVTGLSRSTINRRVEAGQFPRPVSLGPRVRAWRSDELDSWIAGLKPVST